MKDGFTFGSAGLILDLEKAFARNGWTPELVKKLCAGSVLANVRKVLTGELVIKVAERAFPVWKTIRLGTHKSVEALKGAIENTNQQISHWADKLAFTLSEKTSVNLITATVGELGFVNHTRYDAICARIRELGYDLCPAEVGPQLRRQYTNQPLGERLAIAMEAIVNPIGNLVIFNVRHDDEILWLGTYDGSPDQCFDLGNRFVFVRRK